MQDQTPIVSIDRLVKHFDISGGTLDRIRFANGRPYMKSTVVKAVNAVSFAIQPGETLSVVGESGCGKSTLARTVIGLYRPNAGTVAFKGQRIDHLSPRAMRPFRSRMQMIFQDPYASLNPRMTVRQILEEPVRFHQPGIKGEELQDRVAEVMRQVGVNPAWRTRYPHEFSGGQRQRISIARALMVDPEFIVADEPISALDVSIQAQILNLLMDMQEKRNLTYLFISHDLSVVEHISSRVAVMYLGRVCEIAPKATLFSNPLHPYTEALFSAIPRLGEQKPNHVKLTGEIPSPIQLPEGCVFHTRCRYADQRCQKEIPDLVDVDNGARVACHRVSERSR
ncbi:MAG: ABC transporter ATP-binding protein [Deltaproteobacteria bacterium]|nr:MAG: ABC transporter ATP-binding protein [Deltaproteobacteria bacterium]